MAALRSPRRSRRGSRGFTLIEVLIVLGIAALLIGSVITGLGASKQAEVARVTNQLANTIRTRLGRILATQNIAAPDLTMEGGVAVLRGVAATEGQRLVLERLVAMEPGVSAVRNEMTVAP